MMQKQTRVLDLFSGMGGFSYGFAKAGFDVTGVDMSEHAGMTYKKIVSNKFHSVDLRENDVQGDFDIVIGGPPCRPWSSVNLSKRGKDHRDFVLLGRYVDHVLSIKPEIFILENVPLLRSDLEFHSQISRLEGAGYSVSSDIFRYSDYGAHSSRRRLFAFGFRNGSAKRFVRGLQLITTKSRTVEDAIGSLRNIEMGEQPDHVWPELKTIKKYVRYYENGKFGWTVLKWNVPAPSFGNVMKTYTLHPDSDPRGSSPRVVSVLEVSRIMGFNHDFKFPDGIGMGHRYQMLVDSVNPIFSEKLANYVKDYLTLDTGITIG